MSHGFSMKPEEALVKIKSGHTRFVNNQPKLGSGIGQNRIKELTTGQAPYATVLTCSDSRVAPEFIFDAGLGDIFICRNAGNIIDEVTLGSIEYAAAHTGCPLLVVLGHESCGACGATVAHYKDPHHHETDNVDDIIRRIMPAVISTKPNFDEKLFTNEVAKTNVAMVTKHIQQRSPLLRKFIEAGSYRVVGAYYNISSGKVDFMQ